VIPPEADIIADLPGNYVGCRKEYIRVYEDTHKLIQDAFAAVLKKEYDNGINLTTDIAIEQSIHRILKAAMKIAVFKTKCPRIRDEGEEQIHRFLTTYAGAELSQAELSEQEGKLKKYISQRQILVTAANVKKHRSGAVTAEIAINAYLKALYRDEPASLKERYTMIEKLSFRARLFSWDNFNENGTGIFTYLNGGLEDHEKIAIVNYMVFAQKYVSYISKDKYTTFLKLARFLQQTRVAEAEVPSSREIPTEEILRSMFTMPPEGAEEETPSLNFAVNIVKRVTRPPTSAEEAAAIAAAEKRAVESDKGGSIIEISDFFAEQTILAAMAQHNILDVVSAFEHLHGSIDERNVLEGGGIDQFNHNPLTTLCLTLWEINSALVCDTPDRFLLYKLSRIIEHILTEQVKTMRQMSSIGEIYDYLHSLELFLLEGVDREFPNRSFNHFMAGIKEEYYGFTAVRNYKEHMHLSRKEIDELVRLRSRDISIHELMKLNMRLLETALSYVGVIERLALGPVTSVRTSNTSNIRSKTRSNNRVKKRLGMRNKSRRANKMLVAYGGSRKRR
jgi:hypothetical protein